MPQSHGKMNTKRIFISYKRVNKTLVDEFLQQLSPEIQDDCWMDLTDINYSTDFESKICKAISQADAFLFMYSKEHTYLDEDDFCNDWTIRELNYAEDQKKKIWLVSIDNTDLTGRLKFRYASYNLVYNAAADIRKLNVEILNWLWQQKTNTRHLIEAYQSLHRGLTEIANQVTVLSMEDRTSRQCPICDTVQEAPFRQSCSKCKYAFPPLYGIWPDLQLTRAEELEIRQFRELWEKYGNDDSTKSSIGIGNEGNNDLDTKTTDLPHIESSEKNSSANLTIDSSQINSEAVPEAKETKELDDAANKTDIPMDNVANTEEPVKDQEEIEEEHRNIAPVVEDGAADKDDADKADDEQDLKPTGDLDFEASFSELNALLAPPVGPAEEQPTDEAEEPTEEETSEETEPASAGLDLTKCNDDLNSMFNLK